MPPKIRNNLPSDSSLKGNTKPARRKKRKKKVYEQNPASSDSSDIEYPEARKKAIDDFLDKHGYSLQKRKKKRRRGRKRKGLLVSQTTNEDGKDNEEEEIAKLLETYRKISPTYLEYKSAMELLWKKKEEEEKQKKLERERQKREFIPERYEKTGATPKMVHPLKFIAHGHNRHHVVMNDPVPSLQKNAYLEAIGMGESKTVDSFLTKKMKAGELARNEKEIFDMIDYVRNRIKSVVKQEMMYMPPLREIYDDGTSHSVRIGMDIQRFTLSRQGVARMDPIMDQFSRHVISPETSSRERSKRMSEGIVDAVDRDLQDIPKIKKIEATEKKAMISLKEAIREYLKEKEKDTMKITLSPEDILQRNDLKKKITPLLQVLQNNQHPGLRRNRDFFSEAVHHIIQEEKTSPSEEGEGDKRAEGISKKHRQRDSGPRSIVLSGGNVGSSSDKSSKKNIFGYVTYSNSPGFKELSRDPYIIDLMKRVAIKYKDPASGKEIIVGHRLVPVNDGEEDTDKDESGNPLSPVELTSFPFKLKGDGKEQTRMMRSIQKMKDESLLPRPEYESVFEQEMAPNEPTIEALFSADGITSRRLNSTPTNRFGQQVRSVGYFESNKRSGTSIPNAKKKMREKRQEADFPTQPGYDRESEPTPEEIKKSIEKAKKERMEDKGIICPQLPNYKDDTREDEEPSVTNKYVFDRKSCIMQLVSQQKKKHQEFEWMITAFGGGTSVEEVLQNPSLYDGAGGEGIAGLGEACSKEYIADFLREPVGNERTCCNGKKCIGVSLPLFKNWPDTKDVASSDGGPILREFYRPDQLRTIMSSCKYPEDQNPCVLCIDFVTTQACFSFAANDTAPKCVIQYYWVKGYNKRILMPFNTGKKNTPTGIILPCKMFRVQDYFLSTTKVVVNGKWVKVRCYEERVYTEDDIGSGGISSVTLDNKAITNKDFWGASVVSANHS